MARRAVDDRVVHGILAVMNRDSPDVDKSEKRDVGELVKREEEGEDVVRYALREAVQRVKCVAGERSGHNPFVVRLVQAFVDHLVMQTAVDPVDKAVGEGDEEGELQDVVPEARTVSGGVVHFGVAADFEEEGGNSKCSDEGDGCDGLYYL